MPLLAKMTILMQEMQLAQGVTGILLDLGAFVILRTSWNCGFDNVPELEDDLGGPVGRATRASCIRRLKRCPHACETLQLSVAHGPVRQQIADTG